MLLVDLAALAQTFQVLPETLFFLSLLIGHSSRLFLGLDFGTFESHRAGGSEEFSLSVFVDLYSDGSELAVDAPNWTSLYSWLSFRS